MGVLLKDNRPETIAHALESIMADRNRLAGMSRYNHGYARSHFLASTAAELLRQQYRGMLENRAGEHMP